MIHVTFLWFKKYYKFCVTINWEYRFMENNIGRF